MAPTIPRWTFTDPCKPEVRPGAREESPSPAWLAAPAMNARDTKKVYIWRLDTGCGPKLYRKCHSHNTPGKRHKNTVQKLQNQYNRWSQKIKVHQEVIRITEATNRTKHNTNKHIKPCWPLRNIVTRKQIEGKREVPRDVRNSKVRRQDKFRRDWSRH